MATRFWLGLLPLISLAVGAAEAATLTVNTTDDYLTSAFIIDNAITDMMSLRAAIEIINSGVFTGACETAGSTVCDITEPFGTNDTIRIHSSLIGRTMHYPISARMSTLKFKALFQLNG